MTQYLHVIITAIIIAATLALALTGHIIGTTALTVIVAAGGVSLGAGTASLTAATSRPTTLQQAPSTVQATGTGTGLT